MKLMIAMLNPMKEELLCVRGNCDTEVDQMVLEFPILADYCLLELDGQTIFATHGHVYNPQNLPMLKDGDILLNGHTHVPSCKTFTKENGQKYTYMNSGSVSIPKEKSERSYIVTSNRESGFGRYDVMLEARGIPVEKIRKYAFAFCGKHVLIGK